MSDWPNAQQKRRGDFVRAVHPINVGRYPDGVVTGVDPRCDCGADFCGTSEQQITVHIGRGSTVYGPGKHWKIIEEKPEWLSKLEADGGTLRSGWSRVEVPNDAA